MDELRKLIVEEFGEKVLELIDPFEKGWLLPLHQNSLEGIVNSVRQSNIKKVLENIYNLTERIIKEKKRVSQDKESNGANNDVLLSARLYGHDISGIHNAVNENVSIFYSRWSSELLKRDNPLNIEISYLTNFRLFGITMAYLASNGDEKFISQIPASQIEALLKNASKESKKINNQMQGYIQSPEYIALYQIVKNAPSSIDVTLERNDAYTKLSVQDNGPGILDKDGNPLPKELIPEIFYGQSTKGINRGIGLQVARRLSELRGGNIELLTKREGLPTLHYVTTQEKGKCIEVTPGIEKGSVFNIYIPHHN